MGPYDGGHVGVNNSEHQIFMITNGKRASVGSERALRPCLRKYSIFTLIFHSDGYRHGMRVTILFTSINKNYHKYF